MKHIIKTIKQNKGRIPPIVIAFLYGLGISAQYSTTDIKITDGITSLTSFGVLIIAFYSFGQWRQQHDAQAVDEVKNRLREAIYKAHDLDNIKLQFSNEREYYVSESSCLLKRLDKKEAELNNIINEIKTFKSDIYSRISSDHQQVIDKKKRLEVDLHELIDRTEKYQKIATDRFISMKETENLLTTSSHKIRSIIYELKFYNEFKNISLENIFETRDRIANKKFTDHKHLRKQQHSEILSLMSLLKKNSI